MPLHTNYLFLIICIFILCISGNFCFAQNEKNTHANNFMEPINHAQDRISKKPFGLYVTTKKSPVSPERFIGFHTGVDFETFDSEKNSEIPIHAICSGKLILKKWV